jgi:hypothetical protein
MGRFIEGADRRQATLLPEAIDNYVGEETSVRVIDAFVDVLDLAALGFDGVTPEETGRPSYHPATMLKIYEQPEPGEARQQHCARQNGVYQPARGQRVQSYQKCVNCRRWHGPRDEH